eukprot:9327601-Alexandrium_andersonii.AAC.1
MDDADAEAQWARPLQPKRGRPSPASPSEAGAPPPGQGKVLDGLKPGEFARLPHQKGLLYVHCGGEGNCGWNCLRVAVNFAQQKSAQATELLLRGLLERSSNLGAAMRSVVQRH